MKRFIVIAILLFASSANAEWSKTDTALQAVYTVVHVVDWSQTRWISKHPYINDNGVIRPVSENNIILGKRPHTDTVDIYFASTLVAHTAISYMLPSNYRKYWQCVTIGFESGVVAKNMSIGIKTDF